MRDAILTAFGTRIRHERQKRGLSQEAFAEKAGIHRTYVGMIERGEKNITLLNILKFSRALELPIDDLLRDLR